MQEVPVHCEKKDCKFWQAAYRHEGNCTASYIHIINKEFWFAQTVGDPEYIPVCDTYESKV